MRLTKSQSIAIAFGIITVFFIVTALLVRERETESPPEETSQTSQVMQASPVPDENRFVLRNFERSEIRDGKKVWEVKAEQGFYNPLSSSIKLTNADLHVYQRDGSSVQVVAENAVLSINGTQLSRAELSGLVRMVRSGGMVIKTERAIYDRDKGMVDMPGPVEMTSPQLDVRGNRLHLDVNNNTLTLSTKVQTVVKPRNEEKQ